MTAQHDITQAYYQIAMCAGALMPAQVLQGQSKDAMQPQCLLEHGCRACAGAKLPGSSLQSLLCAVSDPCHVAAAAASDRHADDFALIIWMVDLHMFCQCLDKLCLCFHNQQLLFGLFDFSFPPIYRGNSCVQCRRPC